MAAQTLAKDTCCACCGDLMRAGVEFRWQTVQIKTGSKVGSYRAAYRPAHTDTHCGGKKQERKDAAYRAAELTGTIAMMRENSIPSEVEAVRGLCLAEFDKRYLAEFDAAAHAELRKTIETA